MYTLKLTTVGSSIEVVIPKEMLKSLKLDKGDSLSAVETPDGYVLTPYNPEIEAQIQSRTSRSSQYYTYSSCGKFRGTRAN
jgi:putative addiction module antidote